MLPLDPVKADEYRAKIRAKRALQEPPVPKGTKRPPEFSSQVSAAISPAHHSKHQFGDKNHNFKGGSLDKNGYRLVSLGRGRQVFEHRMVMERMIGRPLLLEETVHHKNGNRSDNRETNLELWSSRNPKGQRIQDKLRYAHEILALYGDMGMFEDDFLS